MSEKRSASPSERRSSPPRMARAATISPGKAAQESTDEVYKGAMEKLVGAASKFNRETTAGILFMKSLENRELDPELFRQTLRSGMNCRLTQAEFETLLPHFRNDKKPEFVNGCDFILLFYRIRFEHRSVLSFKEDICNFH